MAFAACVQACRAVLASTTVYYEGIVCFCRKPSSICDSNPFNQPLARRIHLYSLAKSIELWDKPHYRSASFKADIKKNLGNVAIPGTGMPLSIFCLNKWTYIVFIAFVYPIACLISAFLQYVSAGTPMPQTYTRTLLEPRNWFAIWRLNCVLMAYHAYITKSRSYKLEDKGVFLLEGARQGVPVSPFLSGEQYVIKHKNIEGGMGIHFFKNFTDGGDWILQQTLENSPPIADLLPEGSPLSTFRVVTASRIWLNSGHQHCKEHLSALKLAELADNGPQSEVSTDPNKASSNDKAPSTGSPEVSVVTVVFRAGFCGAKTDHNSILFRVDTAAGQYLDGTVNQHWYKLGWKGVGLCRNGCYSGITHHPQSGKSVAGTPVPELSTMLDICIKGHKKLVPDVPLVGWDVALTDAGTVLLEMNLSCNFFNGIFDYASYDTFVHDFFSELEHRQQCPSC